MILVLFIAVEQDEVHPETPGVEVILVPAVDELGACSDVVEFAVDEDGLDALDVDVVLFQTM